MDVAEYHMCHACTASAVTMTRVVVYKRSAFSEGMRDIPACAKHRKDVRQIGGLVSERTLSDDIVKRKIV